MGEESESTFTNELPEISIEQRLFNIAVDLGFTETPELRNIREQCKPDLLLRESRKLIKQYQNLASQQVGEEQKPRDYSPVQAGLMVASAGLLYRNGLIKESEGDLGKAHLYLREMGDLENAKKLMTVLLSGYGIRYKAR